MSKYWKKRQKQLFDNLEKDEKVLIKKLSGQYSKEINSLEKDIAYYYQAYGVDNVIEYRSLMLGLPDADRKLLMERMDDFARAYPEHAHLMPVRASIYKLNRLEGLQQSLYLQQMELGAIDIKQLTAHLEKQAALGYSAAAKELGFGTQFNTINSAVLKKIVDSKWLNETNFSKRIWGNREKLTQYLANDFRDAIIRGDSYAKCVKQLRERFGVGESAAERLIYTEGTYVMNEASMLPFEEMGYEEYTYDAIEDKRTCPICSGLNGQTFKIRDRVPGTNFPPMHTRCRCSYLIADVEEKAGEGLKNQ